MACLAGTTFVGISCESSGGDCVDSSISASHSTSASSLSAENWKVAEHYFILRLPPPVVLENEKNTHVTFDYTQNVFYFGHFLNTFVACIIILKFHQISKTLKLKIQMRHLKREKNAMPLKIQCHAFTIKKPTMFSVPS